MRSTPMASRVVAMGRRPDPARAIAPTPLVGVGEADRKLREKSCGIRGLWRRPDCLRRVGQARLGRAPAHHCAARATGRANSLSCRKAARVTPRWGLRRAFWLRTEGCALVLRHNSRETQRPVHGAFREAVVDPAFMPGKTGADYCVFSPVHGAYQSSGLSHSGSPVNGAGRKSSFAVGEPGVNAGPNTAAPKPRERGKPVSSGGQRCVEQRGLRTQGCRMRPRLGHRPGRAMHRDPGLFASRVAATRRHSKVQSIARRAQHQGVGCKPERVAARSKELRERVVQPRDREVP